MRIRWQITFSKIEFNTICESQCKNTRGRRLHSSSLKDAAWLEDVQLIFLIFYTSAYYFFPANRVYPAKITDMCMQY